MIDTLVAVVFVYIGLPTGLAVLVFIGLHRLYVAGFRKSLRFARAFVSGLAFALLLLAGVAAFLAMPFVLASLMTYQVAVALAVGLLVACWLEWDDERRKDARGLKP